MLNLQNNTGKSLLGPRGQKYLTVEYDIIIAPNVNICYINRFFHLTTNIDVRYRPDQTSRFGEARHVAAPGPTPAQVWQQTKRPQQNTACVL